MRRYIETVFDDVVVGSGFTSSDYDLLLASTDRFSLHLVGEYIGGTDVELEVGLQTCADGRNWTQRGVLVSGLRLGAFGTTDSYFTSESGTNLGDRRARLYFDLASTVGTAQAHLRVIACGRDSRPRVTRTALPTCDHCGSPTVKASFMPDGGRELRDSPLLRRAREAEPSSAPRGIPGDSPAAAARRAATRRTDDGR